MHIGFHFILAKANFKFYITTFILLAFQVNIIVSVYKPTIYTHC